MRLVCQKDQKYNVWLLREMKDIAVSFTPEDLIQNMASIGHIKTTETIPPSRIDQEKKTKVNFQTGKIKSVIYD